MTMLELVNLAISGTEWEWSHAVGISEAAEHAIEMDRAKDELCKLRDQLTTARYAGVAKLRVETLLNVGDYI